MALQSKLIKYKSPFFHRMQLYLLLRTQVNTLEARRFERCGLRRIVLTGKQAQIVATVQNILTPSALYLLRCPRV